MKNKKILLYLMIAISLILCIPSLTYLTTNKTVDGFDGFYTFSLYKSGDINISTISAFVFIGMILLFSILYIYIIKKDKELFKNIKQVLIFIIIISFIFVIMLPNLSSDIFYYIGDSWLCSRYHQNPYYTTVKDLQDSGINDEILNNTGYWKNTVSVYGPLYNTLSIGLSSLSFGNITIALFIFKIASLIVHIINCYLIKKITKNNKYVLLYGLNPLILIEFLANVHNDIYLILFLLLTLYFLVKKKNVFMTLVCLALSIAIKYSTVLIVPFILIYIFRKKSILKRITYCMLAGIGIVGIVVLLYMPFYRDMSIFTNMLVQGNRYSQSIMAIIIFKASEKVFLLINSLRMPVFAALYLLFLIRTLFSKEIVLGKVLKRYNFLMIFFIFLVLTNFQKWYMLWLIPTIFWQNKNMRNFIINLTLTGIIPSITYFRIENDVFRKGVYYSAAVLILAISLTILGIIIREKEKLSMKLICNRIKQYLTFNR